eukprot:gb/GECG01016745.1/.p1 GENE.gb/GECG01016745.1/~~gb/GECG01016745.1/.p1  ORF type:complete len:588 (+),score=86.49 gb/GECG01016745.1/:1-1764(+)
MDPPRKKFTSRYYGVSWHKSSQRWAVQIRHDGKRIHVGYFADELEAAIAYDKIARNLRGTHTKTNFHEPPESITGEATGAVQQMMPIQTQGLSHYSGSGLAENPRTIEPQHPSGNGVEWGRASHPAEQATPGGLFSPVRPKGGNQQQRFFFGQAYEEQQAQTPASRPPSGSSYPPPVSNYAEMFPQQQHHSPLGQPPSESMYRMRQPSTPVDTRFDRDMYYYQGHGGIQQSGGVSLGHSVQGGPASGGRYYSPPQQTAQDEQYMQHGTGVPRHEQAQPVSSGAMWSGQPQYQRSFSDSGFSLQGMSYHQQPQRYNQYDPYKSSEDISSAKAAEHYRSMHGAQQFQSGSSFHSSESGPYAMNRSQASMQRHHSFDVGSFHSSVPSGVSAMHSANSMHSVNPTGIRGASRPSHRTMSDPQGSFFSASSSSSQLYPQPLQQAPQTEQEGYFDNGSSWNQGAVEATRILNSMSQNPNEHKNHRKERLALNEVDYKSVESGSEGDEEMVEDVWNINTTVPAPAPASQIIPPTPMRRVAPPQERHFQFEGQVAGEAGKSEAQQPQMRRTLTSSDVDARARRQAFQGYLGFGSR